MLKNRLYITQKYDFAGFGVEKSASFLCRVTRGASSVIAPAGF
jgi:hypothetical protein